MSDPTAVPDWDRPRACELRILLPDEAATEALGERLGQCLQPGEALALVGDLGAGKTCLARGVGRGLAVDDPEGVTSPTYLLVVEHPGPVPLIHVDAYLPDKTRWFLADGGLDYVLGRDAVLVVEWADRIPDLLPARTLWLRLGPAAPGGGGASGGQEEGRLAILREAGNDTGSWQQFPWVNELPETEPGP